MVVSPHTETRVHLDNVRVRILHVDVRDSLFGLKVAI